MMMSILLSLLFYRTPSFAFTDDETRRYEELSSSIGNGQAIPYCLPYPKFRFLQYLSLQETYLFHGSNHHDIEEFEPREQTLINNELATAVFATAEPFWALFYAVLDRNLLTGSFRNGCLINGDKKYVFYSLNQATFERKPWREGTLYIVPRDKFRRSVRTKLQFDEWISTESVAPIGKISVNSADFYHLNRVAIHKDQESILKTWLFYKARILLS